MGSGSPTAPGVKVQFRQLLLCYLGFLLLDTAKPGSKVPMSAELSHTLLILLHLGQDLPHHVFNFRITLLSFAKSSDN